MDLSLGFLFCSIDLYFFLCTSTILSWWLLICSIAKSSRLIPPVPFFFLKIALAISIQIMKLFVLVLWKIPLVAWQGLRWIYGLLCVVYSFSQYWLFQYTNMLYFSIYLCPIWFFHHFFYSFLNIGLLFLYVDIFLSILFFLVRWCWNCFLNFSLCFLIVSV